jgi:hypothetical protein
MIFSSKTPISARPRPLPRPRRLGVAVSTMSQRPTAVIACRVLQDLLGSRLAYGVAAEWLDASLHNTPKKMAAALQERIDALTEPSNVIIGYGLCGNGLVGVKSREHTLIIPRMHDCVAMFLGSHQRYLQRFFANPGTYYLTRGWIEAKDEPLTDYLGYVKEFDQETADYLVEMKYRHYRKLCIVGFSEAEIVSCRPAVRKVAQFCKERFGMEYEEMIGTTELVEALLSEPAHLVKDNDTFVIVAPGGEITMEMFLRPGEAAPPAAQRRGG